MTTDAFQNCLKLDQIYVMGNNFPDLPSGFAQSCSAVKSLRLENNHIKTVKKDALRGLSSLEEIYLNGNEITTIDVLTFTHTPNLLIIFLGQNVLTSIHPDLFATNSPGYLNFEMNQIQSLPALRMKSFNKMYAFSFDQNQINSIDRKFMTDYFSIQGHPVGFFFRDNVCYSTSAKESQRVKSLNLNDNICISGAYQGQQAVQSNLESFKSCFDNWDTTSTTSNPLNPSCDSHRDCRFYLDHEKVYVCVLENVDLILSSIGGEHQTIGQKNTPMLTLKRFT
jgi:hypothetical protein